MFSIQGLLGKSDKFQVLLVGAAEEAKASILSLIKILQHPEKKATMDEFSLAHQKEKRISETIRTELVRTFVTGLEREDIETLARVLYKIPKTAEKFAERFILCAAHYQEMDFARHVILLEKAASILVTMVSDLRRPNLERAKADNDKLQAIENEADNLLMDLYRDLFSGKHQPVTVVILKDLYELLEKMLDRCRDVGNVVTHIVLKNS